MPLITNLEAVAASLTINNITFTVCSIYISPSLQITHGDLIDIVNQLPTPIILLGDFNAHNYLWGGNTTDARGREVEHLLSITNLCLWNNKDSTYLHPGTGSKTSIDLSICSANLFQDFTWTVGDDNMGSDHFPIFINTIIPFNSNKLPKWQFKKANWPKFNLLCKEELPKYIFHDSPDPVKLFSDIIFSIAEQCIPKSSTIPQKPQKPWFDEECKDAIKLRNKAFNHFNHFPTERNFASYKHLHAKARQIIKLKKKTCWRTYIAGLNSNTSSKKIWAIIRKINGKTTDPLVHHLHTADGNVTLPKDISNTLAKTFANNSSADHYSPIFNQHKTHAELEPLDFTSPIQYQYNKHFSLRELEKALSSSKNTSVGPDEIHYEILCNLPVLGHQILLSIFNVIWDNGSFPQSWRKAIIIPISKPGKDPIDPNNYRPIALTSCVCKIMERMVNNRLTWYLEHNQIYNKYQCGFRKGRSTIDHLVRLETLIREAFVNKQHLVTVFFDLEKAYDTTWKYGIMKDLHSMGLRGHLPTFIHNFLADRTFQVRLGTILSNAYNQEMGVPQGSILSVTLFNIKINSITNCLGPNIGCSLYVDDFLICYRSTYMPTIERQLQSCLNRLQLWCDTNGFKFSTSKTVCMHFCQLRKPHSDPSLKLNNKEIPIVKQFKFLGLIFDSKLSFIPHLKYLKTKCSKAINILKVTGHYDWGADLKTLLALYKSLIKSKLDYGSIVYGSARSSYTKILEPIQNQALRICLGAFRTSPGKSLCVQANILPLEFQRMKLSIQYALKLKNHPDNPAHECVFSPQYEERFTSRDTIICPFGLRIKQHLEHIGIDMDVLCQEGIPFFPPWEYNPPVIDLSLTKYKKYSTSPEIFKQQYYILRETYMNHMAIFTDGSKMDDKVASAAITGDKIFVRRLPDKSSIFSAELTAISLAFNFISRSHQNRFIIFSDSLSCLQAFTSFDVKNPLLQEVINQYLSIQHKTIIMAWIPSHIGIPGNEKVDQIAKSALDLQFTNSSVPCSDFRPCVTTYVNTQWQQQWNLETRNKLHKIKPILGEWPPGFRKVRREEVVLARLRIGHTHFTNSYLLKGEPVPECISCQEPLTVEHILLHCVEFNHVRPQFFHCNNIRELFDKVSPQKILQFVRSIGIYHRI